MNIQIEYGNNLQKSLELCYKYLKDKYEKEVLNLNDWNLCEGEHRGTGEKWIQPNGSAKTM